MERVTQLNAAMAEEAGRPAGLRNT